MSILADDVLDGLKDRGIIPSNRSQLTDTRFFAMLDRVIESKIVPLLKSVNQDHFVVPYETPLVASQSLYAIPKRAIGRGLRELKLLDASGMVRNLTKISLEDAYRYSSLGYTVGFYFQGDRIRLVPDVPSTLGGTYTLQIWYECEPSRTTTVSAAGLVVSASSTDVVVGSVPSTFSAGTLVDFVQGGSGNAIYGIDAAIASVNGATLGFAANTVPQTAPDALAAGDYVTLAGYSPVLNWIPRSCFSYTESLLTKRVLTSIGDTEGAKALDGVIKEEKEDLLKILDPRISGEPQVTINRSSLVRGWRNRQRTWLYGS